MSIYKAYDIRGIYPAELDERIARRVGMALVEYLHARRLVVGRDMRTMAPQVTDALIEGITSMGCEVADIGLASTPLVYHAIGTIPCDGGVAVTASHNAKEYIGLKLCRAGPRPLSGDSGIPEIEAMVKGEEPQTSSQQGRRESVEVKAGFIDRVVELVGGPDAIPAQRIAVDHANGMGAAEAPEAFARFPGLEVVPLFDELDGTFPNHEANPLKEANLESLRETIAREGATLGLAFDGDADRCAFVDRDGRTVGADLITAILAPYFLGRAPGKGVIYDLRSSRIVPERIGELGGEPVRERVGHSFMKETMRQRGCIGGGELSGHFYFAEFHYSDCGLLAGLAVLAELGRSGKDLKEAADGFRRYHQSGEINFRVEDKEALMEEVVRRYSDGELDRLDGILIEYPDWWLNVRPSNTEPFLRLVMEADSPELLDAKRAELVSILGDPI